MSAPFLRAFAGLFRVAQSNKPRAVCDDPRILVIRRNRMGDMLCTLPLLRALRARFPAARITVACDWAGEPIALACSAVDEIITLRRGWKLWLAPLRYVRQWQEFDWIIAAKAGFDSRLAVLSRMTNAARRVGYENVDTSDYYTDPVPVPANSSNVHQIEATLRLLEPLGVPQQADLVADLRLDLPDSALAFANALAPFWEGRTLILINFSSTSPLRFREEDLGALVNELANRPDVAVGLVGLPADLSRAQKMASQAAGRAEVFATPGPLELAALIAHARVLLTAEGGAAHLAAAVGTAAVVLWSQGPFEKWQSRGANHTFVQRETGENDLPLSRVRDAVEAHLENKPAQTRA